MKSSVAALPGIDSHDLFDLKPLPYKYDALAPFLSSEAVQEHHLKHQGAYVRNLKSLLSGLDIGTSMSLEDLISKFRDVPNADAVVSSIFNNAAQIWNHEFFWNSMTDIPTRERAAKELQIVFDMNELKSRFLTAGQEAFGSAWLWIAREKDGDIVTVVTHDAKTLAATETKPLLVCDLWEHSYYLDFRSNRAKYLESFWKNIDWQSFYERLREAHLAGA